MSGDPPMSVTTTHEDVGTVFFYRRQTGGWATTGTPSTRLDVALGDDQIRDVGRSVSVSETGQVIAAGGAGILLVDPDGAGSMPAAATTWEGAAFVWVAIAAPPGEDVAPGFITGVPVTHETARLTASGRRQGIVSGRRWR